MRHRYSCPLRWADLDLLGHVNNVRYVDYLQEARADLFAGAGVGGALADARVRRHELTFRSPLMFGREPVEVETRVSDLGATGMVLEHEIRDAVGPDPTSYLRARTVLDVPAGADLTGLSAYVEIPEGAPSTPAPVAVRALDERRYPLQVRLSDLAGGEVSDISFVEYFQEARIGFFERMLHELPDRGGLRWVVAQTDIDYLRSLAWSASPYDCHTRLSRLGNTSLTVESVIRDAAGTEYATARVVLVVFDPATQRAATPPPGYREALQRMLTAD